MKHKSILKHLLLDACCYPNFKLLTMLKGASGCVGGINGILIKMFDVEKKN